MPPTPHTNIRDVNSGQNTKTSETYCGILRNPVPKAARFAFLCPPSSGAGRAEHHLEVIYSTVNELKLEAPATARAKASANSFNLYLGILLFAAISVGERRRGKSAREKENLSADDNSVFTMEGGRVGVVEKRWGVPQKSR